MSKITKNKKTILTDEKLWKKKWNNIDFPIHLNPQKRAERVFINLFDMYLANNGKNKKTCLEIGCNPGKFLIYCSKNLNYDVVGLDYDKEGVAITKRNFLESGIDAEIIKKNFFNYETDRKFDLILSLGFIEHFQGKNLQKAINKHVSLLNKGGKLFLSVPNFRYINYLFAHIFRKKILDVHNLEVMQKSFFINLAKKNNLEIEYLDYFGGFHPGGIKLGNNNLLSKFFTDFLIFNYEKISVLDNFNSKFFSHHLGAVLKKN